MFHVERYFVSHHRPPGGRPAVPGGLAAPGGPGHPVLPLARYHDLTAAVERHLSRIAWRGGLNHQLCRRGRHFDRHGLADEPLDLDRYGHPDGPHDLLDPLDRDEAVAD